MTNTPSSIVCFKNGYSFMCVPVILSDNSASDVAADDQVQSCLLGPLSGTVVHGTIGLQPDNPDNLRIISLSKAPVKKKAPSRLNIPQDGEISIQSILSANIGNYVKLGINVSNHGETVTGNIKWVQNSINNPTESFVVIEKNESNRGWRHGRAIWTKTDFLVNVSKINSIESESNSEEDDNEPRIAVRYHSKENDSGSGAVLSYLTQGLTWAPSYSIVLDKTSKTLRLEGKACLLCDLSFMETGDIIPEICLVAGQPNMLYQKVIDPLVSNESALDFINTVNCKLSGTERRARENPFMNAGFMTSRQGFGASNVEDAEAIDGGEAVEDFFHYILKNVPIKHNHAISMDFITPVPNIRYEDVYYVNLNNADADNKGDVEVKHAISFKNLTEQPLTSAPATVLAKAETNSKFLVQGRMKYTGPGQDATLEITTTMDVQVKFGITTLDTTKQKELDNPGSEYMIATTVKKGKVELVNNKNEMVKCKVEYKLHGDMIESDPLVKDKVENSGSRHHGINSFTKQIWEIEMNPNGKKTISFSYNWKERIHAGNKKKD